MAVWPASLPQQVSWQNYHGAPRDSRIDTPMDAGLPKSRRRFTTALEEIACSQLLDKTQIATLQTFYETTLQSGTLEIEWVHPLTQAAVSMKFARKPTWSARGPNAFDVQYVFHIYP